METSPTIGTATAASGEQELDERVKQLPTNVLECRANNHYLPIDFATRERIREDGRDLYETRYICPRCRMERVDITDRYNPRLLLRRSYHPDESYGPAEKGGGRIPKADARAELHRRRWGDDA